MPTDSKTGLFGTLPAQMAAARRVGVPRLRQAERRQVSLRPISLEDLLPPDHRARFVWAFAERLDLTALYRAIKAVEGYPGHPPADPRILLVLWLLATGEGVGSARELDRLCREHIGFEWMCGGVGMNHTTLAGFRVAQSLEPSHPKPLPAVHRPRQAQEGRTRRLHPKASWHPPHHRQDPSAMARRLTRNTVAQGPSARSPRQPHPRNRPATPPPS
jgi:transposase